MAEETTRTSPESGPAPAAPAPESPGPAPQPSTTVTIPPASYAQPQPDYGQRINDLEQQISRYQSNIKGWEQQSQRHLDENTTLRQQLQQQQTLLQTLGQTLTGQQPQQAAAPADLAEAVNRYLAGDDTALRGVAPMRRDDVAQVVDQRLGAYLSYMQRQQAVTTQHPELADRNDPVYKEVFESYDQVVQDPMVQLLYPQDPNMLVSIVSPDGTQQKTMDLRILDRAVLTAKSRRQGETSESRRQSAGDVTPGNGRAASGRGQEVEAVDLLTEGEIAQYTDPDFVRALQKADPKIPTEIKALAKYVLDGIPAHDLARRMDRYRSRGRGGA